MSGQIQLINTTYESVKPFISDLDLIFFKGTELVSRIIMDAEKTWLGAGDWSHCGIVISKRSLPSLNSTEPDDTLYLWESTISSNEKIITNDDVPDIESGKCVFGVQIRKLDDVIAEDFKMGVTCYWAKLISNPINQIPSESDQDFNMRKSIIKGQLDQLHKQYYHEPYPLDFFRISRAVFGCCNCIKTVDARKCVFCSQFVTIVYQTLGIVPKSIDPGLVSPEEIGNYVFAKKTFNILNDFITPPIKMIT
jgi:hypothetical protein